MKTRTSSDIMMMLVCTVTLLVGAAKASRAVDDRSFFALGRVPLLASDGSNEGSSKTTSTWLLLSSSSSSSSGILRSSAAVPADPSGHQASWQRTARGGSAFASPLLPPSTPALPLRQMTATGVLDQPQQQAVLPRVVQQLGQTPQFLQKQVLQRLPFWRPSSSSATTSNTEPTMEQVLGIHEPRAITMPIFGTNVWESLTGTEFVDNPTLVDQLVSTGRQVLAQVPGDDNPWVEWTAADATAGGVDDNEESIHTWTGTSRVQGYGSQAPWIKTQAVVPFAPTMLAQLLLDSKRVQSYHASAATRQDLWVNLSASGTTTKICRHVTQSPLGWPNEYTSLLHARAVPDDLHKKDVDNVNPSWLVVSRAVGGKAFCSDTDAKGVSRSSQVLLGVNLLEAVPGRPDSTRMTTISHVYHKSGEHPGLKPAVKFVEALREMHAKQYRK